MKISNPDRKKDLKTKTLKKKSFKNQDTNQSNKNLSKTLIDNIT